jgi:hypothetical protein
MNPGRTFAPLILLAASALCGCNPASTDGAALTPAATEDPRLREVAARFLCPCSRCGPMNLSECGCEMPNGAVAVKTYISTQLDKGASVDEAASMVAATFHARAAQ